MEKVYCADCGREIDLENDDYEVVNDEYVCQHCIEENYSQCYECGEYYYTNDMTWTDNGWVCDDCICEYEECADCGEWYRKDDMYWITNPDGDDYYVCESCYDGEMYCDECFQDCSGGIMGYHDFSDWEEHSHVGDTSIIKGFELEIEDIGSGLSCSDMADVLREVLGDFCVFETDGSLDDGFEVISHPFSMEWLYEHQDMIKRMFDKLNRYSYGDTNNTGLHVHVNRAQLNQDANLTRDEVIDNILLIMETFKDELTKFSRRDYGELQRWAKFLTDDEVDKGQIDSEKGKSRYQALNLTKDATIEFRLFKSTDDFDTFMATIELVDRIVELAKDDIDGLTWSHICNYGQYLTQYTETTDTVLRLAKVEEPQEEVKHDSNYVKYGDKEYECVYQKGNMYLVYIGEHFGGHSGNEVNDFNFATSGLDEHYRGHLWWFLREELTF